METICTEIMLYVNDVHAAKEFWTQKMGFVIDEERKGPANSDAYVIHAKDQTLRFVLMDKALVQTYSPEVNSGAPSILFKVSHLQETYENLKKKGVKVTDIFTVGTLLTFSFCDPDGNYYAVSAR